MEGSAVTNIGSHFLIKIVKNGKCGPFRRRCKGCYQKLKIVMHWREAYKASKQVCTMCNICDKCYCIECFLDCHKELNTTDRIRS